MSCFDFPSASDSRSISDLRAIHAETCAIETAILDARDQGARCTTITDSPMTTSQDYYNAWNTYVDQAQCGATSIPAEDAHLLDLQSQILSCFGSLGYSIVRKTNTTTGMTFYWEVCW